jgi:NAD+ kinase
MRLALVVHPTRPVTGALETLERWAKEHEVEVVQIPTDGGSDRDLAPKDQLDDGDLVVTLGGDGTVLAGLRAATTVDSPVLGVACGSLGALTAVRADRLEDALDRFQAGDWDARRLPALVITPEGADPTWAVNDFVVARHGAGQVVVGLTAGDELYVRLSGDGLIVATPLGSSAYSMAAGGPVLSPDTAAIVCTPLAMHGGNAPPLVIPASTPARVEIHPSFSGFHIEIDGRRSELEALNYDISLVEGKNTLVDLGDGVRMLSSLRERGIIADSPRVLARDKREGG